MTETQGCEACRRDIAHDLHDDIGHYLACICAELRSVEARECFASPRIDRLRRLSETALNAVRSLSRQLRVPMDDGIPLVTAIEGCVREFELTWEIVGETSIVGDETARLDPALGVALYRIMQEALTNIGRHSGADRFSVTVDLRGPVVRMVISDNGHGMVQPMSAGGVGVSSMKDRAARLGGTLTVESRPGEGATVTVSIPVPGGAA